MEMHVLPWIKKDIAIEIIGKMIAEQMEQVYKLVADYREKGFGYDSQEVINDARYQQLLERIGYFKQEIDQVYDGERLEALYKKVDEEYVPHLKMISLQAEEAPVVTKFSDETDGFVYVKQNDGRGIDERTSYTNSQVNEDRSDSFGADIPKESRH